MVSFTAANTRRMFDVSVACVRLPITSALHGIYLFAEDLLWVEVEVSSIHLVEPPEKVFRRTVDIVSAGVVREVVTQW